jgi:uncharacterized protein
MPANAKEIISSLDLLPHPEGGFYKETYRSTDQIPGGTLPSFGSDRSVATGIYFLLESGDKSVFHRIKSDEVWHHYDGGALEVLEISKDGELMTTLLGKDAAKGEVYQYTVPAGVWFGSRPAKGVEFVLVGCTVAPGFDFEDFEMANQDELKKEFPDHHKTIEELT